MTGSPLFIGRLLLCLCANFFYRERCFVVFVCFFVFDSFFCFFFSCFLYFTFCFFFFFFFFQAEDGIRDHCVTGVQTCALPIYFLMFRPPSLLASRIAPTAVSFPTGQLRRLHPSRTCVVAFARIGYAIGRLQAINRTGTLTPLDSQFCRLLPIPIARSRF